MKLAQIVQILFAALAAVMVYSFMTTAKDGERRRACTPLCALQPHYAARNRLVPSFRLPDLQGKKVAIEDYRGKVVILNFWTKTCRPCLEEMPSLAGLAKVLREHPGVELVTISTDESAADARATLQSVLGGELPFTVLMDPEAKVVTDTFGTKLFPETWFIDPSGVIRARIDGARDWANALTVEFAESLRQPLSCKIEFSAGQPLGGQAELCSDIGI
jgi:peroxiredoxin